jgi:hypothetical protein
MNTQPNPGGMHSKGSMPMRRNWPFVKGLLFAGLVAAFSTLASQGFAQRGENPFAPMIGSWSGAGTLSLSNGTRERIRCRASYRPDGAASSLALELRCASDSYRFELQSNVSHNGSDLSGTWSEATRGAGGSISGTVSRGRIQARATSPAFSALLAMSTSGSRQSISIQSPGSELEAVNISLSRSR